MAESRKKMIERAHEVVRRLEEEYPNATCSLKYESNHQLLVARKGT